MFPVVFLAVVPGFDVNKLYLLCCVVECNEFGFPRKQGEADKCELQPAFWEKDLLKYYYTHVASQASPEVLRACSLQRLENREGFVL